MNRKIQLKNKSVADKRVTTQVFTVELVPNVTCVEVSQNNNYLDNAFKLLNDTSYYQKQNRIITRKLHATGRK